MYRRALAATRPPTRVPLERMGLRMILDRIHSPNALPTTYQADQMFPSRRIQMIGTVSKGDMSDVTLRSHVSHVLEMAGKPGSRGKVARERLESRGSRESHAILASLMQLERATIPNDDRLIKAASRRSLKRALGGANMTERDRGRGAAVSMSQRMAV